MSKDIVDFLARVVVAVTNARILRLELSGVSEWPMIVRMMTTSRPQRRYLTLGFGISSNAPGT